jgi:hypothetical protein
MEKIKTKSGYDTNLAAEFYVMSCLHRLGITASLTLGNKKGVDVLVAQENGETLTVEVKGVAKRYDWPANNIQSKNPSHHFIVLVSFDGEISKLTMPAPKIWIIPMPELQKFIRVYKGQMTVVSRAAVSEAGSAFKDAWHLIEPRVAEPNQRTK